MSLLATSAVRRQQFLSLQDRILIGAYFRHVAIVLVMLTTIAVAIDTASWIARVGTAAAAAGGSPILAIVRFIGLRALDNGVQTLPIAAILGFIWSEASYHQSGHRLADRITGRTERRAMRSILVASLVVAGCQTILDNIARPYAVETMIRERMAFWTRYTQMVPKRSTWVATDGAVVQGRLTDIGSSELTDVTYYGFDGNRATTIVTANSLRPAGIVNDAGVPIWLFENASFLDLSQFPVQNDFSNTDTPAQKIDRMELAMAIDPAWLPLAPIKPVYLTLPELSQLALMEHVPDGAPNYGAWLLGRLTAGIVLGLLCGFIAVFFRGQVDRRGIVTTIAMSLALGYGGVLAMRVLRVVAEYSSASPFAMASIVPGLLLLMIGFTIRENTRHDGVGRAAVAAGRNTGAA